MKCTSEAAWCQPDRQRGPASGVRCRQWTVVVSVDFFTVARSPAGVTPMPFEEVCVLSTVTPLVLVLCSLLLELEPPYTTAGAAVVDWVDVVVDEEVCATATPVIIARAVVAASQDLIMWCPFGN